MLILPNVGVSSTVLILPNVGQQTYNQKRLIETSLGDGVICTQGSCVANSLYRFELIVINRVYSAQCRAVNIQSERLIETSLSDGVNCTHGSCVANLLYKFELIVINSVYSTHCRVVNILSETTDCDITE